MEKWCLLLIVASACVAREVPVSREYPRFIQLSYGEVLREVDLQEGINVELLERATRNDDNNRYLLFTRRNTHLPQLLTYDRDSINNSNFDRNAPTVIICHGWGGGQYSPVNNGIRDAFLGRGNANVIVVDWNQAASQNYVTAVALVPSVGRNVGKFLSFLNEVTGVPLKSIHLTGFSLGAHVVGNAGKELNGEVGRVTGLDPAGPLWNLNPYSLRESDAIYTEAIHTDGALLGQGIGSSVAQVDFFPNGGNQQPGCSTSSCNHSRAWEFFAATVTYNHLYGVECSNNQQVASDTCSGRLFPMGNDNVTKQGSSLFRLNTAAEYPYLLTV